MRRFVVSSLLLGAALALPACVSSAPASSDDGEAAIGVTGQALSTNDVARVVVTVTGTGITSAITYSLKKTAGQWGGVMGQIPAGTNRSFHADVFDASNNVIYAGDATGVTIANHQTATVVLVLQQKTAPDPFKNTVPFIDSATASSSSVGPGDAVSLNVAAHDVDAGDTVTYAWSTTGGAFDSTTSTHPVWTAPATEGTYALTVTVKDSKNATRSLTLNVDVHAANGRGSAAVSAAFNTWPVVTSVLATPGRVDVGQPTTLATAASDPDGDALTYAWSDGGCGGNFSSTAAQNPTWTAPATAPSAGTCSLVVTVTDGRGGVTTGTVVEQVGAPLSVGLAPVVTATAQSAASVSAGGTVTLDVAASDPAGQTLSFGWSSSGGALGAAASTASTSEIVWTAPASGGPYTITATVTDAGGLVTTQSFSVSLTASACAPGLADCNGNAADGCEQDIATNVNNCGACGVTCAGSCLAGVCTVTPASCASSGDGLSNCGPGGSDSCCASLLVSGVATASFSRSYDGVTPGYTSPQFKAQVSDFKLDKYEVTVGRFRKYVDAVVGGWQPPAGAGKHKHLNGGSGLAASGGGFEAGWDASWNTATNFPTARATWDTNLRAGGWPTWTSTAGANEKLPINNIDWYDAEAFCIWDGGFLPSEAEWNYTAAGGTEQRVYPWGSTAPGANTLLADYGCYYNSTGSCLGGNVAPVGSIPAGNGKWGQSDLAGNLFEWNLDWFKSPYSETSCVNCSYVTTDTNRVVRGGAFNFGATGLVTGARAWDLPTARYGNYGARCARTPS